MNTPGASARSGRTILVLGSAAIVAMAAALAAYALSYPLNHDVGWYLYVAGEMLEGEGLYTSFIEINPPLSTYLSVGPVLFASLLGAPLEPVTETVVLLVSLLVAGWATSLVARAGSGSLAAVFAGILLIGFLGIPGIDFGQREHLMVVFTAPYMVILWLRIVGGDPSRSTAVASGVLAGIGIALKPHFVVIWLALEAWAFLRTRSGGRLSPLRAESVAVAATGGAYVLIILMLHSEYVTLLWDARKLYGRFNAQSRLDLLTSAYLVPLLAGLYLRRDAVSRAAELASVYLVFAWAGFAVMVVQGKGWSYHLLPVVAGTLTFAALIAVDAIRSWQWSVRPPDLARVATFALLLAGTALTVGTTASRHLGEKDRRIAELSARVPFFANAPPGAAALFLTHRVEEGFPLVTRSGLEWGSAFSHLWWIKALYEGPAGGELEVHSPQEMGGLERRYVAALVDRMTTLGPEYVLVDTVARSYYGNQAFPYIRYLEQMPAFAEEWRYYEPTGSLGGFAVWRRNHTPVRAEAAPFGPKLP